MKDPDRNKPSRQQLTFPRILLAADRRRNADALQLALRNEGFTVHLAEDYLQVDPLWREHRHGIVLLDVSNAHAVEAAVDTAMRIKRHDPRQFVGYLADPVLYSGGLTGDAIFSRDAVHLSQALRSHFATAEPAE